MGGMAVADLSTRALATVAMLLAGNLPAAEDYFDYADVVSAVPVTEAVPHTGRRGSCPGETDSRPMTPGPARGAGIHGLMDAVVRDLALVDCREQAATTQRIVGYRVTYRYDGTEYINVLDEDPGQRLRVKVRLEARP
jgi:uncharacterized protein YcfJ